jgi:outer membrane protein insertion porin family
MHHACRPAWRRAQDTAPAPAQAPAAVVQEQGDVIRSIVVVGAQRLEPETILSYIQLRVPGRSIPPVRADEALKDLAATELFADYAIANNAGRGDHHGRGKPGHQPRRAGRQPRLEDDKILPEDQARPAPDLHPFQGARGRARIIELYKRQGRLPPRSSRRWCSWTRTAST